MEDLVKTYMNLEQFRHVAYWTFFISRVMEIWFLMLVTTRAGWNSLELVMVANIRKEMAARKRS